MGKSRLTGTVIASLLVIVCVQADAGILGVVAKQILRAADDVPVHSAPLERPLIVSQTTGSAYSHGAFGSHRFPPIQYPSQIDGTSQPYHALYSNRASSAIFRERRSQWAAAIREDHARLAGEEFVVNPVGGGHEDFTVKWFDDAYLDALEGASHQCRQAQARQLGESALEQFIEIDSFNRRGLLGEYAKSMAIVNALNHGVIKQLGIERLSVSLDKQALDIDGFTVELFSACGYSVSFTNTSKLSVDGPRITSTDIQL